MGLKMGLLYGSVPQVKPVVGSFHIQTHLHPQGLLLIVPIAPDKFPSTHKGSW